MDHWIGQLYRCDHDPEFPDNDDLWILVYFGDEVVPRLIESLEQREVWSTAGVIELQFMASPKTVQLLAAALGHLHPSVRRGALEALLGISARWHARPEVIEPLRKVLPAIAERLQDSDPAVSRFAVHFLKTEGSELDPSFIVPIQGLDDPQAAKRVIAVQMLGQRPAEEAVPLLEMKLKDSERSVRWEAAEQLSHLDPDHPGIAPIFVDYLRGRESITAIGYCGLDRIILRALPALREALKTEGPKVQVSIIHGLGWSRSGAVLPALLEVLNDDNANVRGAAVQSLHFMETETVLPFLIKAAEDESDCVRANVRWAFRQRPALA